MKHTLFLMSLLFLTSCDVARELAHPARFIVTCRYGNGQEIRMRCEEAAQHMMAGGTLVVSKCKDDEYGGKDFEALLSCPVIIVKDSEAK